MTQKELRELHKSELRKAWEDEKMVDYCSKNAAYYVEYEGGLYSIEKPRIKKDFCFSYGQSGISTEEDYQGAANAAERVRKNEDYFIEANMEDIDWTVEKLQRIHEQMGYNWADGDHPVIMVGTTPKYTRQAEDCKLKSFQIIDTWRFPNSYSEYANQELIGLMLEGYEQVKKDFEKRLRTYLKRYGTSKLNTWTYLVD